MGTKLALKVKEAFVQYSKKMCTWVTIFWMIYRVIISILIFLKPETSNAMVHLTDGADTVMIANISVYTGNSICEKGFYAFGKRKPYNINAPAKEDDDDDDSDDEEEEEDEDSNG